MSVFDISSRRLTTLKDIHFPENVTILSCKNNHLTSLEYCPATVTKLYCEDNQLTSLEYCPVSVTKLDCGDNQLTSLEHCPASVIDLYWANNPLNDEYKDLSCNEIHKLNRKKSFQKGLGIVQKMVQNSMAMRIQKKWRWWFFDDLDDEGVSRFCRRAVDELNDNIS